MTRLEAIHNPIILKISILFSLYPISQWKNALWPTEYFFISHQHEQTWKLEIFLLLLFKWTVAIFGFSVQFPFIFTTMHHDSKSCTNIFCKCFMMQKIQSRSITGISFYQSYPLLHSLMLGKQWQTVTCYWGSKTNSYNTALNADYAKWR